jgi:hypothetical protein
MECINVYSVVAIVDGYMGKEYLSLYDFSCPFFNKPLDAEEKIF